MKNGLLYVCIVLGLAVTARADTLLLTVTGTGGATEQRVTLTPGTTLRVSDSGSVEVVADADFKTALGLVTVAGDTVGIPTDGSLATLTPTGTASDIGLTLESKGLSGMNLKGQTVDLTSYSTIGLDGPGGVQLSSYIAIDLNANFGTITLNAASVLANGVPIATTAQLDTKEDAGPYAVFWIPLSPGDQWTDFELKGSTDDFLSDTPNMVFFYHSPDPGKSVIWQQVWTTRPDVYFTDSGKTGTPNRRAWIKQTATDSIFALLADANSEVGGFLIIVRDDLSAHRDDMVWSYNLMDGVSSDNDAAGRSVWRPIVPIKWTTNLNPTIN